jgi:uncharacterized protein
MRTHGDGRVLPDPTPLTLSFFEAGARGTLLLPHCPGDGFFFHPRVRCPTCLRTGWSWKEAPHGGTIHTFTVDRVGLDPANRMRLPLVIALVDLDAGPRLVGAMLDCTPESVQPGMRVEACFESIGEAAILCFRPEPSRGAGLEVRDAP